jgi:hypothetical protein
VGVRWIVFSFERLRCSLKYELIYPGDFANVGEPIADLDRCFHFYNHRRPPPGRRLPHAGRSVPAPVNARMYAGREEAKAEPEHVP